MKRLLHSGFLIILILVIWQIAANCTNAVFVPKPMVVFKDFIQLCLLGQLIIAFKYSFDEELIEGNTWYDNYWGNCTCEKCKNIIGRNQLGKTLMKIRDDLRKNKRGI